MAGPPATDPVDSTVAASTGAATFEIPIALPPGPGGLAPRLSLAYSSHAGDGALGVGWRLPLGEIRCTARFGVPDYAACPQYALDGELLLGPDAAGHYHTFVESFRRIRPIAAAGGELAWEVTEADGTRLLFGTREDARIRAGGAGGPVARWRLAEVRDVFGNAIALGYDASEPGTAELVQVDYGVRRVRLFYEPRPDPLHDFAGGIERVATRRLREIQVESDGRVHQRLVLDYAAEGDYSTHRTRLVSVQRFGADCPPFPQPLAGCSALPPHSFAYSDPGDAATATPDGSQWLLDPAWPDFDGVGETRTADVDGDGLPDLLVAHCVHPEWPCAEPGQGIRAVHRNTGSGWDPNPDPLWSAALAALRWEAPVLHVVQPMGGDPEGAGACRALPGSLPSGVFFTRRDRDGFALDLNALAVTSDPLSGQALQTIGVEAHWRVLDVDGDGRADLVAASRVGGVWEKWSDDCGSDVPDRYVEATARAVFLNDGAGWQRAPSLEAGLPTLAAMEISDHFGSMPGDDLWGDCEFYGWYGRDAHSGYPPGICRQMVHYAVDFVELDGDGRLDILAALPLDPRMLPDYEGGGCPYYDLCAYNPDRTLAFVQRPDANGDYAWVRDPRFDLLDPVTGAALHHRHLIQVTRDVNALHASGEGSFFSMDDGFRLVDLNGDRLTDVVWRDPYAASGHPHPGGPSVAAAVLLNTGAGWCASLPGSPCADAARLAVPAPVDATPTGHPGVYATTGLPPLRDVSGDGLPDFSLRDEDGGERLRLFTPGGAEAWRRDDSGRFDGAGLVRFDYDGDGALDRWRWAGPDTALERSQSRLPDLLRRVENGRGGVFSFTYTTAAAQRDPALEALAAEHAARVEPAGGGAPRFTPRPLVASVRVEGPNRTPATTAYAYAAPAWCPVHRSGLGFRLVRQTRPDGSTVDRFFHQQHGRAGRLSERIVRDGGRVLHHTRETWALVDPAGVAGAFPGDGGSGFGSGEPVRVGRLVARTAAFEYGAVPGEAPGATLAESYAYDDVHGHGFVSRVAVTRPTSSLVTTRVPAAPDSERWLFGLVARETVASEERDLVLRDTTFTYTREGRVASETQRNARRESGAAPGAPVVTRTDYDERGNVSRRVDANGRVTEHCYDGNPAGHAWCDAPPGDGSVAVAVRDPEGVVATRTPDPVFGAAIATDSGYRDVPGSRLALDAFGRPVAAIVVPEGGEGVLAEETFYDDAARPPTVETLVYVDAEGSDAVRTLRVGDGFGGVWRRVEAVPPDAGGAPRFVGVATHRDPAARATRTTLPIPCGSDAACSALVGASETPARRTERDAVGRPLRRDAPEGVSLWRYARAVSDPVVRAPGEVESLSPPPLDAVLARNAKGDLLRQSRDGDRVVVVDECANAPDPSRGSLEGVACHAPDRTLLGYLYADAPEVVYDPVATAGARWDDDRHRRLALRDTLGRVVELRDPDAGRSYTAYDGVGNPVTTLDARGRRRDYVYDALDRLTTVGTPPGEADVHIEHAAGQRLPSVESVGGHVARLRYDEFGRLAAEETENAGRILAAEYASDLLGRRVSIRYRGVPGAIRYEYAGAYLEAVCRGVSCARPDVVYFEDVAYDDLGRRSAIALPGGTRHFGYSDDADPDAPRRLVRDAFAGTGPSGHAVEHRYEAHDGLGNVLAWSLRGPLPGMDVDGSYGYDARNRLASATRGGATDLYEYDALGNRTLHAGAALVYAHAAKPHAITARPGEGAHYAHDASGNLSSRTGPLAGDDRHFAFDSASRLVCVGSAPGACDLLRVHYDARGRRIREEAGGRTRRFLGDGLLTSEGADGTSERRVEVYAFGERIAFTVHPPAPRSAASPARRGPAAIPVRAIAVLAAALALVLLAPVLCAAPGRPARRPAAGTLALLWVASLLLPFPSPGGGGGSGAVHRFVLSDRIGSGGVELDADGEVLRHVRFRPFGAVEVESAPPGAGPGRRVFAGHPAQPESGLVAMRARWLDPASGTMLSVDPVVAGASDPQAHNGYAYARHNPVNRTDPTGLCAVCPPPYPPFLVDAPPAFPTAARARYRVDVSGRVFGGRWLFGGRTPPGPGGDPGRALASQPFDLDRLGNPRRPRPPASNAGLGAPGSGLVSAVGGALRWAVDLLVGEDGGAAWRGFVSPWEPGPTGGVLPRGLAGRLVDVLARLPAGADANGMHAWHAGSNAALAKALGLVGAPLIVLGGILHETPVDLGSFRAEFRHQGALNHALDSISDVGANVLGLGIGYLVPRGPAAIDAAVRIGNHVPGPGEPDPRFGGGGPYTGDPSAAWGQYP